MNKLSFLSDSPDTVPALTKSILRFCQKKTKPLVVLCIGSDRLTGDSLGPLVGHHLTVSHGADTFVYGTLERPVTAKNLTDTIAFLKTRHSRSLVLVVDAALGQSEDIGVIRITRGGLNPGAGVDKVLPRVGDISITAVVASLDGDKRLSLAGTRLSLVYNLSLTISLAIAEALKIRKGLSPIRVIDCSSPDCRYARHLGSVM